MGVSGQFHAPAALPPGKDPSVPIPQKDSTAGLDAAEYREMSLARSRNQTLTVQIAVRRYAASKGKLDFATLVS
jgi:hypothetical protein